MKDRLDDFSEPHNQETSLLTTKALNKFTKEAVNSKGFFSLKGKEFIPQILEQLPQTEISSSLLNTEILEESLEEKNVD